MGVTRDALARPTTTGDRGSILVVAGLASAAAGLIHAAAAGSHADQVGLARGFVVVAVAQLAAAGALLVAPRRPWTSAAVVAVNLLAVAAWVTTRIVGVGPVDGLGSPGPIGVADGLAAALAAGAVAIGVASRAGAIGPTRDVPLTGIAAVVLVIAAVALVDVTRHDHAHGDVDASAHGHGGDHSAVHDHGRTIADLDPSDGNATALVRVDPLDVVRSGSHGHDDGHAHADTDSAESPDPTATSVGGAPDHGHGAPAVPPRPYDPTLPIDLGGVDGVTPEQQAFAENLVAVTLRYLPRWSDPTVAEAAGFRSIGDGVTGHEHFVNWAWIDDDVWMDPTRPESLVFEVGPDGTRELAAAMFMLPPAMSLDDIPDWGGPLMQWHVHEDLCYTDDPVAPRVAAVIPIGGTCPPGLVAKDPAPMIHVWIRPHECGPFAALDGIGAGQVRPGEEHLCNHVHGAGTAGR